MKRSTPKGRGAPAGPSQRQLRAGELTRHALVEILREHEIKRPGHWLGRLGEHTGGAD